MPKINTNYEAQEKTLYVYKILETVLEYNLF